MARKTAGRVEQCIKKVTSGAKAAVGTLAGMTTFSRMAEYCGSQRSSKLAEYCDRYRTVSDVRPLLEAILSPLNEGRVRPESTQTVEKYVEGFYLLYTEENLKPSTCAGYKTPWAIYLKKCLTKIALRDFRTVDAANLLSTIHREHAVGRTMLKHIKSFLSGVFTYAKNQDVLDGVNPIRDTMISRKAASPEETHATSRMKSLRL